MQPQPKTNVSFEAAEESCPVLYAASEQKSGYPSIICAKKKFKVANFWIVTIAAVGVVVILQLFFFLCLVGWCLLQANKLK